MKARRDTDGKVGVAVLPVVVFAMVNHAMSGAKQVIADGPRPFGFYLKIVPMENRQDIYAQSSIFLRVEAPE